MVCDNQSDFNVIRVSKYFEIADCRHNIIVMLVKKWFKMWWKLLSCFRIKNKYFLNHRKKEKGRLDHALSFCFLRYDIFKKGGDQAARDFGVSPYLEELNANDGEHELQDVGDKDYVPDSLYGYDDALYYVLRAYQF